MLPSVDLSQRNLHIPSVAGTARLPTTSYFYPIAGRNFRISSQAMDRSCLLVTISMVREVAVLTSMVLGAGGTGRTCVNLLLDSSI